MRRSENDYRRRRTAICALLEAPIIVIATVPEEFIFAAFSMLHTTHKYDERNRVLLLKYVVAHIRKSENLAAFEAAMGADRHLAEALREFERYDAEVARGYVDAGLKGHRRSREAFQSYARGEKTLPKVLGIPEDASFAEYQRLMHERGISPRLSILAPSELLAERCGAENAAERSVAVAESYDMSIDAYFAARSLG